MAYLLLYCSHQNKNVITGREGKIKTKFSIKQKEKKCTCSKRKDANKNKQTKLIYLFSRFTVTAQ